MFPCHIFTKLEIILFVTITNALIDANERRRRGFIRGDRAFVIHRSRWNQAERPLSIVPILLSGSIDRNRATLRSPADLALPSTYPSNWFNQAYRHVGYIRDEQPCTRLGSRWDKARRFNLQRDPFAFIDLRVGKLWIATYDACAQVGYKWRILLVE